MSTDMGSCARRWSILTTALYCCAMTIFGLSVNLVGPNLPALAHAAMGDRVADLGPMFIFRGVGGMPGAPLLGAALDHVRGHTLLAITLVAMAVPSALIPHATRLSHLCALFFSLGVAYGGINTVIGTLITWVQPDRVGMFVNLIHGVFGIGSSVAPIVAAQCALHPPFPHGSGARGLTAL